MTCWTEGKIETVTVEVHLENRKLLFCRVYRPPGAVPEEFFEGFECFISRIRASNLDCIYAGDFNFNLLNLSGVILDFFNLMVSSNYFPTSGIPTRITDHSATLIDNIFVPGGLISNCICDVVIIPGSHNLPIVCSFKSLSRGKSGSQEEVKERQSWPI